MRSARAALRTVHAAPRLWLAVAASYRSPRVHRWAQCVCACVRARARLEAAAGSRSRRHREAVSAAGQRAVRQCDARGRHCPSPQITDGCAYTQAVGHACVSVCARDECTDREAGGGRQRAERTGSGRMRWLRCAAIAVDATWSSDGVSVAAAAVECAQRSRMPMLLCVSASRCAPTDPTQWAAHPIHRPSSSRRPAPLGPISLPCSRSKRNHTTNDTTYINNNPHGWCMCDGFIHGMELDVATGSLRNRPHK